MYIEVHSLVQVHIIANLELCQSKSAENSIISLNLYLKLALMSLEVG